MVNLPLSGVKTEAFFWAWEVKPLNVRRPATITPKIIVVLETIGICCDPSTSTPATRSMRRLQRHRVCHSPGSGAARIARKCAQNDTSVRNAISRRSSLRVFHHEMSFAGTGGNDSSLQNLGHHAGRLSGAVHAVIRQLIGRQPLRVERAKAGLVAKERAAGHGHAPGQQDLWRSI